MSTNHQNHAIEKKSLLKDKQIKSTKNHKMIDGIISISKQMDMNGALNG